MAQPCDLTTSYSYTACATGVAGVSEMLIIPYDYVTAITITAGVVSAITKAASTVFRRYQFKRGVAMFTDNGKKDPKNGTKFYTPHFEGSLLGWTSVMREELDLVAQNTCIIIVKKRNGTYWLAGRDKGVDLIDWSAETGTDVGDFEGQKLIIEGEEAVRSVEVPANLIAALLV